MKKYLYSFLGLILLIGTVAYAKQANYPTLSENGKTYYIYTVQKSEGLYAVSQRFGIPQALILEANPGIQADGLKLGQMIKIPKASIHTSSQKAAVKVGKNQHVVKAKETLYSLSKKYNCTVDDLLELNPWATHLTIGSVLQLPSNEVEGQKSKVESQRKPSAEAKTVPEPVEGPSYGYAEAGKSKVEGQRSEVESQKSKVEDQEAEVAENEVAKPKKNIWSWFTKKQKPVTPATEIKADSIVSNDSIEDGTEALPWWEKQQETEVKVAILLPFMLDSVKRDASMDRFVEFYQGCLMAIDSLSKQGLSTEIFTYDTGSDAVSLQMVLQQPALSQVDLIIGPAYQNQVESVSHFAAKHRIPTVIPFSSSVPGINTNPYLFEVVTPQKELYPQLVQKCCFYFSNKEIIVVKPRMVAQHNKADFSNQFTQAMQQLAIPYTVISDDSLAKEIDSIAIRTTKECLVVMPSTHGVALNKLGEAMENIKPNNVALFGFPEWNNLGINELYDKKMYQFSNYQTNFNDPQIVAFFNQLRNQYGVPKNIQQSPNFALFGFDICYFFLQQYSLNGKHFAKFLPEMETRGLQMNFLFQQVENGGYWNVGTQFQQITAAGISNF